MTHRGGWIAAQWLMQLMVLVVAGCDDSGGSASQTSTTSSPLQITAPEPARPTGTLELVFPYGSEKKEWLQEAAAAFNSDGHASPQGRRIVVKPMPMGSGESIREILDGRLEAHLVSPASAAFIRLGNAESQTKTGQDLVGQTRELVLSPVVIAMWKPMAEAIGWGKKPVGWEQVLQLAQDPTGWARHGLPQWGRFKFGHTHPQYSNSGLISLFAEVYAATGKQAGLTLDDVNAPATAQYLRGIEQSIVHYGSSTGFFGTRMFGNGPEFLSAAVLYENMVIESYDSRKYPNLGQPVVAIYPKEGTFWSDHPVGVVKRPWVTADHAAAAGQFVDYLLARPQQERAMHYGFRPADPTVPIAAPIDADHGVDPSEPKTTLEVPGVDVMDAIIALWRTHKKHADVVLVIDTSGSMKGERIDNARRGAIEMINLLGDEDRLSLLQFSSQSNWLLQRTALKDCRSQAVSLIESMIADGGTALYDATAEAHRFLADAPEVELINAVVVLTDGEDRNSTLPLSKLVEAVRFLPERSAIRVFTIGYGGQANADELTRIAEETRAKFFKGDPKNIREVFKEIATFF